MDEVTTVLIGLAVASFVTGLSLSALAIIVFGSKTWITLMVIATIDFAGSLYLLMSFGGRDWWISLLGSVFIFGVALWMRGRSIRSPA